MRPLVLSSILLSAAFVVGCGVDNIQAPSPSAVATPRARHKQFQDGVRLHDDRRSWCDVHVGIRHQRARRHCRQLRRWQQALSTGYVLHSRTGPMRHTEIWYD